MKNHLPDTLADIVVALGRATTLAQRSMVVAKQLEKDARHTLEMIRSGGRRRESVGTR